MADLHQLWLDYWQHRSPQTRRMLIERYAPLARHVVDRLNLTPGVALDYDDLLGEAVIGLIHAIERFDPTRGIKFETFAHHRIRGAVIDMLRQLDWLPRAVRQKEAKLTEAFAALQAELGRPPSDDEVAAALGLSSKELDALAHEVALQAVQSLDETLAIAEGEAVTLADIVADSDAVSPETALEQQAQRELLASAISALPDAERTVIGLYYHEGMTLKEIGRVFGVTESRVCQIHGKAIVRLRAHIQAALAVPEPAQETMATTPG